MSRTVYVNGTYLPETEAKVSIFDRGFLMADGVYEVTSVLDGKLIDFEGHQVRLNRSLNELEMDAPVSDDDLLEIHQTKHYKHLRYLSAIHASGIMKLRFVLKPFSFIFLIHRLK